MPEHQQQILQEFQSRSSDVIYKIVRGVDGVIWCSCPAWRMRQGRASCKHLDMWRKENFRRPTAVSRDPGLRIQSVQVGDIVEVNSRGDVFLLKVTSKEDSVLNGKEILDAGEAPCNRDSARAVDFRDVTRVVIPAS